MRKKPFRGVDRTRIDAVCDLMKAAQQWAKAADADDARRAAGIPSTISNTEAYCNALAKTLDAARAINQRVGNLNHEL